MAPRAAIGSYCFKKGITYILNKCKWLTITNLITYSSLNTLHKTFMGKKPISMMSLFRESNRNCKNV